METPNDITRQRQKNINKNILLIICFVTIMYLNLPTILSGNDLVIFTRI